MHLCLDKVKQHARSKMYQIALLAEVDTTTQIGQALSDTYSAELKAAIDKFILRRKECNYFLLPSASRPEYSRRPNACRTQYKIVNIHAYIGTSVSGTSNANSTCTLPFFCFLSSVKMIFFQLLTGYH